MLPPTNDAIAPIDNTYYSASSGLIQTHPSLSGDIRKPQQNSSPSIKPKPLITRPNGSVVTVNPIAPSVNPKSPFRHLDFATSATAELRRNPSLSAPDECARACHEGEPPRICYYHFTLEYYTVLGA